MKRAEPVHLCRFWYEKVSNGKMSFQYISTRQGYFR
jgi:hypothetical protein